KFANPQIINVTGGITALAAGNLGNAGSFTNLVLGVSGTNNSSSLLVLGNTGVGFGALASLPLSAPASNILFGEFGDPGSDVAFLSGGQVYILRSSNPQLQAVSLPVIAYGLALGSFVPDRSNGLQMALLASDGSIQIVAHNEFDPRIYTL